MKTFMFLPLIALMLLISAVAYADIGKKQAVSIAQDVQPGRVLAVKMEQQNGTSIYRVKTLSADGDVHIIVIDAESGKVISK